MDQLIVWLLVGGAAGYVAWKAFRTWSGKSDCGSCSSCSSCSSCPMTGKEAEKTANKKKA